MGNSYKPKLIYNDMAGALTANPIASITNGRGLVRAECVRGVGNISWLRLAWRSMTGTLMSAIALIQENTVGKRKSAENVDLGLKSPTDP